MPVELKNNTENFDDIKEVYNGSVYLLELLNVLISKISNNESRFKYDLVQELSSQCFELGSLIINKSEEITEEKLDPTDDDEYDNWHVPFGMGL